MNNAKATHLRGWLPLALWLFALTGCAVQWVAEYDKVTEERLLSTYEQVNRLYDDIAQTPTAERHYNQFAKGWADVSTSLRVVALRQKARVDNKESHKIVDTLIRHWEQTRARHKAYSDDAAHRKNAYPDSRIELDRKQFEDEFADAVQAEVFKK